MKKLSRRHVIILGIVSLVIITVVGGTWAWLNVFRHEPVISSQILSKANFTIFHPRIDEKSSDAWQLQKDRTSYDKDSGVLTLHVLQSSTGREIVLNEQPVPGTFSDVPTQYSTMLNTLHEYNELQLGFGTVALTYPEELKGEQTAVANKAGTLIFAKPSANLTDSEWQSFFESLRILR